MSIYKILIRLMFIGTHIMWQLQAAIHCTRHRLRPGEWDLSNQEGRSTDRHAGGRKQRKNNNKYTPKVFLIIFHRAHGTRFSRASVGRRVGAAIARSRALRPVYNRVFLRIFIIINFTIVVIHVPFSRGYVYNTVYGMLR